MIPAGRLDRALRLMKPVDTTNDLNERITTYEEVDTVLGGRDDRRGSIRQEADQRVNERITVFTIWYYPELTERWKIVDEDRWYEIMHRGEVGRRVALELECRNISIPEHYQEEDS